MTSEQKEPERKISEAFLEFSEPLWVSEAGKPTRIELERALKISWLVWNAAVTDAIRGTDEALAKLRENLPEAPEVLKVCELMLRRKQRLYASDLRLIHEYQVVDDSGKWRLQVKALAAP
jgi:hypothetical protein